MAKAIHDYTEQTILVVCYTNHALDDILTSLLDVGIPESSMVRIGTKSTSRTENLALNKQTAPPRGRGDWEDIDSAKLMLDKLQGDISNSFTRHMSRKITHHDVLEHLQFEDAEHYEAFLVPEQDDGMQIVGKGGRAVEADYLLERWVSGQDAGVFVSAETVQFASEIWGMDHKARATKYREWRDQLEAEHVDSLYASIESYNHHFANLDKAFASRDISILSTKRIIGCTTSAAAKYGFSIRSSRPDVVLVEEAGEILEAHILTALSPSLSQLILIGDHKSVTFLLYWIELLN